MPESCSSMGAATVLERVSALAPGKVAVMMTVGGVISGYWATGRVWEAIRPAITTMMEITDAKIGRLMKKRVMTAASSGFRLRGLGSALGFRRLLHDGHAGAQLDEVVHDHLVAGFQAFGDDPVLAHPLGGLHRPGGDLALRPDEHHQPPLVGLHDSGLGHEEDEIGR